MRKNLIIASVLLIGMFSACAQSKKATKSTSKIKTAVAKSNVEVSSLTMRRGACFGKCPEYSITINSNGMAEYKGGRNAEMQGDFSKNIGVENAQKLLQECSTYRVDTCADLYKVRISDLPGMHFVFTINGQEKRITNAHEGPYYLTTIAEEVDKLGMPDKTWKQAGK